MKIAIHHSKASFSERWIEYCEAQDIPYKVVDCYQSDIISRLEGCSALMWHHNHADPKDVLFARQLLASVEASGRVAFPNHATTWHFDDKVGQKYLLEAVGAPVVPSHVYYTKKEALAAIENASYPLVFKLRGGAGARNVMLIKNRPQALRMINKSFGRGFRQYDAIGGVKEQLRKFKLGKAKPVDILKAAAHIVYPLNLERSKGREAGYFYYQQFMPNNDSDVRVIVIGDKAFAIKRMVRENDFRASGSGNIIYDRDQIDTRCVAIAFEVSAKLKTQCIAYDFVFDAQKNPLIVEISYGFAYKAYDKCPGYWNDKMEWQEGSFNALGFMVDEVVKMAEENLVK